MKISEYSNIIINIRLLFEALICEEREINNDEAEQLELWIDQIIQYATNNQKIDLEQRLTAYRKRYPDIINPIIDRLMQNTATENVTTPNSFGLR